MLESNSSLAVFPSSGQTRVPIRVREFGCQDYAATLAAMREFTELRTSDTPDEIWLLEHPPVFTLGQAGRAEHLLRESTIPLIRTERGGQITYHGPGQAVAYLLIDLKRAKIMVREFVHQIEAAVIETLAAYNLEAVRKPGAPGIYVLLNGELNKIAALGLKIRNGSTFHGVSLNVAMDLEPFTWINPCGYEGLRSVDMKTLGVAADLSKVAQYLAAALISQFEGKDRDE